MAGNNLIKCGTIPAKSNNATFLTLPELETCYSDTPNSGTSVANPFTTVKVDTAVKKANNDTIRGHNQAEAKVTTGLDAGMSATGQFMLGAYDNLFPGIMTADWSTEIVQHAFTARTAITAATTVTVDGIDITKSIPNLAKIKLYGFANPENNTVVTVDSVAYDAATKVSTLTVSGNALVAEAKSRLAGMTDASDMVYMSTSATVGATPKSIVDAGSTAFTDLETAFKLRKGQRVFLNVSGAYEKGTIDIAANPVDGKIVTIKNGDNIAIFEFDDDDIVASGRTKVDIGATAALTAQNLITAINEAYTQRNTDFFAVAGAGAGEVTVTNGLVVGGTVTSDANPVSVVITAFAGGLPDSTGVFTVDSIVGDTLTFEEDLPAVATAGTVTLQGSHIRAEGLSTLDRAIRGSRTMQRGFPDANSYYLISGMIAKELKLTIGANDTAKISMAWEGRTVRAVAADILGAAPYDKVNAPVTLPVNTSTQVVEFKFDGESFQGQILSIDLEIMRKVSRNPSVSQLTAISISQYNLEPMIKASIGKKDLGKFNDMLQNKEGSFSIGFQDSAGGMMFFHVPKLSTDKVDMSAGGVDTNITEAIEMSGSYSDVYETALMIDRFSSTRANMV